MNLDRKLCLTTFDAPPPFWLFLPLKVLSGCTFECKVTQNRTTHLNKFCSSQNGRLLEPWSSFSTSLRRHRRSQTCVPDLEPGLMSDLLTGSRDTRRPYENRQIRVKRIHGPKGSVMLSQKLNILFHAFVPMWMPCVPRKWDLVHKIKESEREKERQQQTP